MTRGRDKSVRRQSGQYDRVDTDGQGEGVDEFGRTVTLRAMRKTSSPSRDRMRASSLFSEVAGAAGSAGSDPCPVSGWNVMLASDGDKGPFRGLQYAMKAVRHECG